MLWNKINTDLHFLWKLKGSKSFLVYDKDPYILHGHYHGCWCPEYSALSNRSVNQIWLLIHSNNMSKYQSIWNQNRIYALMSCVPLMYFEYTCLSKIRPSCPVHWPFLLPMQIWWNIKITSIQLLSIGLLHFAHATTTQLSYHVQNFVAIITLEFRWK